MGEEGAQPIEALEPTVLVVNPGALEGRARFQQARAELEAQGVFLAGAYLVEDPRQLTLRLAESLAQGARRVVLGGGDGTLTSAVDLLVGTGVVLGILPLGTANDFARSLELPFDLPGACAVIAHGAVRVVDLGRANGNFFLNAMSLGYSSSVTRSVDGFKRRVGRLAYVAAATAELANLSPFRVALHANGQVLETQALQVVAGNGRYQGGGRLIAPDAAPDNGLLEVYVLRTEAERPLGRITEAAKFALLQTFGRHLVDPNVLHFRTPRLVVEAEPPQEFGLDGELSGWTPVMVEAVPSALRVLVPVRTGRPE